MNVKKIYHLGTGDIMVCLEGITIRTNFDTQTATIDFEELDEFAFVPLYSIIEIIRQAISCEVK